MRARRASPRRAWRCRAASPPRPRSRRRRGRSRVDRAATGPCRRDDRLRAGRYRAAEPRRATGARERDRLATDADGLVEHRPLSDRSPLRRSCSGVGASRCSASVCSRADAPRRVRLSLSVGSTARPAGRGRPHRLATFTTFPNGGSPAMAAGPQGQIAIVWMTSEGRLERDGSACAWRSAGRTAASTHPHGGVRATVQTGVYDPQRWPWPIGAPRRRRRGLQRPVAGPSPSISVRTPPSRPAGFGRPQAPRTRTPSVVDLAARAVAQRAASCVAWAHARTAARRSDDAVRRARGDAGAACGAVRPDAGHRSRRGEPRARAATGCASRWRADGSALLAWSNARGRFRRRQLPAPGGDRRARAAASGPVAELAANGAPGDVAVRDDGAALVAWTDARGYASRRPSPATPRRAATGPGAAASVRPSSSPRRRPTRLRPRRGRRLRPAARGRARRRVWTAVRRLGTSSSSRPARASPGTRRPGS